MAFTRMDQSSLDEWRQIGREVARRQARMPEKIIELLQQLEGQTDGFAVDQLVHSLQTATRAVRENASEELIVAALCHDIGKAISVENHPAIAAEMLKPYVSEEIYEVIRTHQDFQGRHYYEMLGRDPEARQKYRDQEWYALAEKFTDQWDQASFDPAYETLPLSYFEPMINRVFGKNIYARLQ